MQADPLGGHLPWSQRDDFLPLLFELGLIPEIALKAADLDTLSLADVNQLAQRFAAAAIRPTVHAPFFDLNPGALDPMIRQVTARRLDQTFAIAGRLNARLIVVHPGFDHWRYPAMENLWMTNALSFFRDLLSRNRTEKCQIAIENIYEQSPDTLVRLVDELDSPRFGHCFDIGHWNMFGLGKLETWLAGIAPRLFHLHLHDNTGSCDDHLPVGDGSIDFNGFFSLLCDLETLPSMTLEAHRPEDLVRSHRQVLNLLSVSSAR